MKKIAIIGSRDYVNLGDVPKFIDTLPKDTIIISGGARGVDRKAEEYAKSKGFEVISIKPLKHSKEYFLYRDIEIITMADEIVAFWNGFSRGTDFSVRYANGRGKIVKIFKGVPGCLYYQVER